MSRVPRLMPLIAVTIGGVLAVTALDGVGAAPDFLKTAAAWAEDAPAGKGAPAPAAKATAAKGAQLPAAKPNAVCAPTAADLAKEAGLSPAELRLLQSLGERRGELDAREKTMDTQIALLAAAEGKLDQKVKALDALKAEIKGLLGQADAQKKAEVGRLVRVYESMKPKDAAAVITQLDDNVRLPVAGAMKERALAAVLAQMPPAEAKRLTEQLAARFTSDPLQAKLAAAIAPAPAAVVAAPAPVKAAAPQRQVAATKASASRRPAPVKAAPKPKPTAAAAAPSTPPAPTVSIAPAGPQPQAPVASPAATPAATSAAAAR